MAKKPLHQVCQKCIKGDHNPNCRILDPTASHSPTYCKYHRCDLGLREVGEIYKLYQRGHQKSLPLLVDGREESVLPVETPEKSGYIIVEGSHKGEFVAEYKRRWRKTGQRMELD